MTGEEFVATVKGLVIISEDDAGLDDALLKVYQTMLEAGGTMLLRFMREGTQGFYYITRYGEPAIVCLWCSQYSYNQNDMEQMYCNRCGVFHGDVTERTETEEVRDL